MTRVLVTGARGFLGRQILPLLCGDGLEVHAVTSRPPATDGGCVWHKADLLESSDRQAIVRDAQADALLHLAWYAKPPDYWRAAENVTWLTASLDLARLFIAGGGTRIVGIGTCAEYDWTEGYCTEGTTPLRAASLYGVTKGACGSVLGAYAGEMGVSAAWGRMFFLFGPFDAPIRLVPSLVRSLAAGQPARCASGSHERDYLHVAEAAAAVVALLRSSVNGPVNIASGVPARVGEIAQHVARRVGRPDLLTVEEGPASNAFVCANVARLRDEVGWRPARGMYAGLDETIDWWRSPEAAATR